MEFHVLQSQHASNMRVVQAVNTSSMTVVQAEHANLQRQESI